MAHSLQSPILSFHEPVSHVPRIILCPGHICGFHIRAFQEEEKKVGRTVAERKQQRHGMSRDSLIEEQWRRSSS